MSLKNFKKERNYKKELDEEEPDEEIDHKKEQDEKKNIVIRNAIVILMSALCLTISLGVNEIFRLHLKNNSKTINEEILFSVKYVFILVLFTLFIAYYLNFKIY
jgi:hypothetical protein